MLNHFKLNYNFNINSLFKNFFYLEAVSFFFYMSSMFSFLYSILCYKGIEIYYNMKIDFFYFFSPQNKFIYSAYYEQIERFKFFLGYWALQFEVTLFFSLSILLLFWSYSLFHKMDSSSVMSVGSAYLIFTIFLLEFCLVFYFFTSLVINLKFFYLNNCYLVDNWVMLSRFWMCVFFQLFLVFYNYFNLSFDASVDFFFLLAFGVMFSFVSVAIFDIFLNFIVLEMLSMIIITLVVYNLSNMSLEASVKYFVFNTIMSGISVFGMFIIFFFVKNSNFSLLMVIFNYGYNFDKVLIMLGLMSWLSIFLFKLNIFPFCFYLLDVYESLAFSLIFYLFSIMKVSLIFLLCKIYFMFKLSELNMIFFIMGICSMFFSSVMALESTKLKSFFALTSINLNGFLLVCVASNSLFAMIFSIFYLFFYNLFSYLMFFKMSSSVNLSDNAYNYVFSDLSLTFMNSSMSKFLLLFFVLSLSGLPPFIMFMYKYVIFLNLFAAGYYVLMFMLICINLFGFYYYLNLIKHIVVENNNIDVQKHLINFSYKVTTANTKINFFFNFFCFTVVLISIIMFVKFDFFFLFGKICVDSLFLFAFFFKLNK